MATYPDMVPSWIGGRETHTPGETIDKFAPHTGEKIAEIACATGVELESAISAARGAYVSWSGMKVEDRIAVLRRATELLRDREADARALVRLECGRPEKELGGEVNAAITAGAFFSELAREFEPKPLSSSNPTRRVETTRTPVGVGALFTPFNTPLAQVAAKMFPALLGGNTLVLKAHELTPYIGVWFARLLQDAGLPDGACNVVQGRGSGIGAALVQHPAVQFISFTGSSRTGALIVQSSAERLAKVSIEGGGKNPFVVCADADIAKAVADAAASMMVDNGQRCAAASRFIVFESVYGTFRAMLVDAISSLKVGPEPESDVGALISRDRLEAVLHAVLSARNRGATLTCGGERIVRDACKAGYFMQPTLLEDVSVEDSIAQEELFGPVAVLFRVRDLDEAIAIANNTRYRLSAAIHTRSPETAERFRIAHGSGVFRINGPTFGSEPQMPFGGPGLSGNGWREPGLQALDFYTNLQQVSSDTV